MQHRSPRGSCNRSIDHSCLPGHTPSLHGVLHLVAPVGRAALAPYGLPQALPNSANLQPAVFGAISPTLLHLSLQLCPCHRYIRGGVRGVIMFMFMGPCSLSEVGSWAASFALLRHDPGRTEGAAVRRWAEMYMYHVPDKTGVDIFRDGRYDSMLPRVTVDTPNKRLDLTLACLSGSRHGSSASHYLLPGRHDPGLVTEFSGLL